mgnify:CR=1 FL=1|tara:strand:- start:1078 stop:1875 length:798 start_codon:yes stop_codon:yes gene_type:complete
MNILVLDSNVNQNLTIVNQFIIFIISYLSNVFSSIAGGGAGLIQLPALILFGIPYYKALASHKIATVALGIGGSVRNYKNLKKNYLIIFQLLIFGIPGVILGTFIVTLLSDEYLYLLLAIFTIGLGIYSFIKPNLGLISIQKKIGLFTYLKFNFIAFIIGILNGSISSGTGLLVTILLIHTFGLDFLSSISITFLTVGIFWNAVGAIALSKIGSLSLNILIILILASFLGGFTGAHLSNLKGNKFIKKLFICLCFLIGLTLLLKF